MLTIRAMSDGKGYSSRHLEHNDYYSEGERVAGEWNGRGAELLGLSGAVNTADFEALRQGLNPSTGEFLRIRHSADARPLTGACSHKGGPFTILRSLPRNPFQYSPFWEAIIG